MSIDTACRSPPSPSTSSVEPPPMSTTRTGSGGIGSCAEIAPAKTSAASSSPDSTSGSMPSRRRTPSRNTAALLASRVAEVAQKRTRAGDTPWRRITSANSSIAANVRSSASSASTPVRSTPWPSRTTRESRSSTSASAPPDTPLDTLPIRILIELVPQSIAATVRAGWVMRSS